MLATIITEDIVTPSASSFLPRLFAATLVICMSFTEMVSLIAAMVLFLKAKMKSTERAVSTDTPDISCRFKGNDDRNKVGVESVW